MTSDPGHLDPEAGLDNAALADALRTLLRDEPPAPADRIDPAQRAAEVSAAITRGWPAGAPPAPTHDHDDHHDGRHQAAHQTDAPPAHGPGHGPRHWHLGLGDHDSSSHHSLGHSPQPPQHLDPAADPSHPSHPGDPGPAHGPH
jgi:hypothetical protein